MKTLNTMFLMGTSEEINLQVNLFNALQDNSKLAEVKSLFAQIKKLNLVDNVSDFISSLMKEDNIAEDCLLFVLKEMENIKPASVEVKVADSEDKVAVKKFINLMIGEKTTFEDVTEKVFKTGSLTSVKFLLNHFKFDIKNVISCAYQNTHDVFFHVFDTYKVDSVFVANLVEEQLIKNKFNLEIVKELILSEDIVVTESLKKYEMIDRVLMMKKFQSKEVNSSNDEVVKI